MKTFKELGLNEDILKSLETLGFEKPTSIQQESIEFLLKSKQDLIALAQTGTGKTAAFSLPILNQIDVNKKRLQAIILCPTRELCLQISEDIKAFSKHLKKTDVTAVYGGSSIENQIRSLKKGTHIVVGTPGRVCDLIRRKVLKLQDIEFLVLDEADEMLDMGFKDDLDAVLAETPETKQTLLFSATLAKSVYSIAKKYMSDFHEISVGEKNTGSDNVTHEYFVVQNRNRFQALQRILDSLPDVYGIVFCRTRHETQEIADKLKQSGYHTDALHGDVSQNMRTKIMSRFKKKHVKLLIATDVAARGIDVNNLTHVINYNLPDQNEAYTHRSGRTGRAHNKGVSLSIITPRELRDIRRIESIIGKEFAKKDVPSGEEICKAQLLTLVQKVKEGRDNNSMGEKYFEMIAEELADFSKEELIRTFFSFEFDRFEQAYKKDEDLNVEAKDIKERPRKKDINFASVILSLGKKDKFNVQSVFELVNQTRKIKGLEIGDIEVRDRETILEVDKQFELDFVTILDGQKYNGSQLSAKSTKIKPKKSSKGRSGSSRGRRRGSGGGRDRRGRSRGGSRGGGRRRR